MKSPIEILVDKLLKYNIEFGFRKNEETNQYEIRYIDCNQEINQPLKEAFEEYTEQFIYEF